MGRRSGATEPGRCPQPGQEVGHEAGGRDGLDHQEHVGGDEGRRGDWLPQETTCSPIAAVDPVVLDRAIEHYLDQIDALGNTRPTC